MVISPDCNSNLLFRQRKSSLNWLGSMILIIFLIVILDKYFSIMKRKLK